MKKNQSIGCRVSEDLYNTLKILSRSHDVSIAEILERSLSYFIDNPRNILFYRSNYYDQYEKTLLEIYNKGIRSKDDLKFITDLIQQAYHNHPSSLVTSKWVQNIVSAFSFLFQSLKPKSVKELAPYFGSTFPGVGDLKTKIADAIKMLEKDKKVNGQAADMISRCLQVLIRDGDIELSDSMLKEVKNLLEPWCFWVAKRAIKQSSGSPLLSDISVLSRDVRKDQKSHFELKKNKVAVRVFLSREQFSSLGIKRKFDFYCYYVFQDLNLINKGNVRFSASSFYDLLQCLDNIKEEQENIASVGDITVYSSADLHGIQTLFSKGSHFTQLSQEEYDEFVSLTWELYSREDVKADIIREHVMNYGAL